jgi:hypothetical protein
VLVQRVLALFVMLELRHYQHTVALQRCIPGIAVDCRMEILSAVILPGFAVRHRFDFGSFVKVKLRIEHYACEGYCDGIFVYLTVAVFQGRSHS